MASHEGEVRSSLGSGVRAAFPFMVYRRFLFSLSCPSDTCVIIAQMCRPSQTSPMAVSLTNDLLGTSDLSVEQRGVIDGINASCKEILILI